MSQFTQPIHNGFKIEKGIAPPAPKAGGSAGMALRALAAADIGDSVLIPMKSNNIPTLNAQARFKAGWYTSREEPGGRRVWKISEPEARD